MIMTWMIFIHVLAAIPFFLAPAACAAMVYKLRSETDFTRIRAMLDLFVSTFQVWCCLLS